VGHLLDEVWGTCACPAGADVWRHDRVRRQTALHYAAGSGASDAIRLVLAQAGAAVHPSNAKT
jgi:hypothetical protein